MTEGHAATIRDVASAIRRHQRFVLATHVRPDGDAIGALLALTFILRRLGKEADPFSQDPTPAIYRFVPGTGDIRHQEPDPGAYEVAVLLDCGELHRVGPTFTDAVRRVPFLINIDHHLNDIPFGDICWVDPSASSTCEMLYDLILELGIELDADLATQLYVGLVTDTGSFRFANTNLRVLELAAALVIAGADPAAIAEEVFDSSSPERVQLLAKTLNTVRFHQDNRIVTAELTQRMLAETGSTYMDSEGFINDLRAVRPVRLAMLFREDPNDVIHVSLRSKGDVDVAAFARERGGGGHRHAAAFRASGAIDAVRDRVTREAAILVDDPTAGSQPN